jgi:hypothetical protein
MENGEITTRNVSKDLHFSHGTTTERVAKERQMCFEDFSQDESICETSRDVTS